MEGSDKHAKNERSSLHRYINDGRLKIENPATNAIRGASCDLTISEIKSLSDENSTIIDFKNTQSYVLQVNETIRVKTVEKLTFSTNIYGVLFPRSVLAREGITCNIAGHIDPGFSGPIVFSLTNNSGRPFKLMYRRKIVCFWINELSEHVKAYDEGYQDLPNLILNKESEQEVFQSVKFNSDVSGKSIHTNLGTESEKEVNTLLSQENTIVQRSEDTANNVKNLLKTQKQLMFLMAVIMLFIAAASQFVQSSSYTVLIALTVFSQSVFIWVFFTYRKEKNAEILYSRQLDPKDREYRLLHAEIDSKKKNK